MIMFLKIFQMDEHLLSMCLYLPEKTRAQKNHNNTMDL